MAKWRVKVSGTKDGAVDVTFDTKGEADARKDAEVAKIKKGAAVSQHLCPHTSDEPSSEWYNCRDDPKAQYTRFVAASQD